MEQIIYDSLAAMPAGVVIADETVARLYPVPFQTITVPAGEACKTFAVAEEVIGKLIKLGANRDTIIIGMGGGAACDLAGFVANIYMRGVRYGLVPTTLLAMVDAAIGGKNGVNIGGFKNMAGTFGEPEFVLCDVATLATLPPREMRSGMAEVVKAAVVGDPVLFDMLHEEYDLEEVIRRAVAVKVTIVERDRHEKGERRLLNLGHTIGHAVEAVSRDYTHGEAVAIGMSMISRGLPTHDRIVALHTHLGLPTTTDIAPELLREAMRADKKGGLIVLPTEIGRCSIAEIEKYSLN